MIVQHQNMEDPRVKEKLSSPEVAQDLRVVSEFFCARISFICYFT